MSAVIRLVGMSYRKSVGLQMQIVVMQVRSWRITVLSKEGIRQQVI